MAIKIQYNKTFLQKLKKDLSIRENALPTLKAKESALRLEVKKARAEAEEVQQALEKRLAELSPTYRLWNEFPDGMVTVENVDLEIRKVAGVKTPIVGTISFKIADYALVANPGWFPPGVELVKELVELTIRKEVADKKIAILEYARKKTTQKVNLYEKVQIPEFNEGILKIKRFLEDDENLAKSSQKILKTRLAAAEVPA